jgi:hypothetical protein
MFGNNYPPQSALGYWAASFDVFHGVLSGLTFFGREKKKRNVFVPVIFLQLLFPVAVKIVCSVTLLPTVFFFGLIDAEKGPISAGDCNLNAAASLFYFEIAPCVMSSTDNVRPKKKKKVSERTLFPFPPTLT